MCDVLRSKVVFEFHVHIPYVLVGETFLLGQLDPLTLQIAPAKLNHREEFGELGYVNLPHIYVGGLAFLIVCSYDH